MMVMDQDLKRIFHEQFGRTPTSHVRAPGRVNLIGEHTDYNQGFVFPAAINFGTTVVAAARDDRIVNVVAVDYGNKCNSFSLDDIQFDREDGWCNYVRGVAQALQGYAPFGGADLLITGNVPQGAGLSSSASLEIALLKSFSELYELELDGVKAALLGQQAENDFVGCSCGIMDQLVSAMGKKGQALLLDCQSLEFQTIPIPPEYQLVIVNSNIQRGLVDGEYNLRRQQCEEAAAAMGVASLRQADMAMLQSHKASMPDTAYRRARHIITENQRTLDMFSALESKDYRRIGELMALSHASMRDDFEITVPQIDYLVELIQSVLGEVGGARMTGGGFGGCVVSLAPREVVPAITEAVERQYRRATGHKETIYVCTAEEGAFA
jgi:galactokinase